MADMGPFIVGEGLATDAWLQTFIDTQDIVPVVRVNGGAVLGGE